jgi:hypothetical protein
MKKIIGTLLWSIGHLANLFVLCVAFVYAAAMVVWMHAPPFAVLALTATMALPVLGIAWLCRLIGKRLQRSAPPVRRNLTPGQARARKWAGAVLGVAIAAALVTLGRTGLDIYECNTRPAAGTPEEREAAIRRDGFKRVCRGDLARYDLSFGALGKATARLAFTPVDLARTPFAQFGSLGGQVEYVNDVPSRLYRGFRTPDGHRLTLFEHDMSADGSRSWRDPKDEPERINGLPARLIVMEDSAGTAASVLSWMEGRRYYELWLDANLARVPFRERLFALAASLPRSMPACPRELPAGSTWEQTELISGESKRPCK